MADYINKVILKGRPGQNPEQRFLPSGDAVCNFNIATKSGNHVEWHRIVAYKNLAERAMRDFASGDLVYIEGEIRTREMITAEDKAQQRKPRKITEIIATALHLVEKKGAGQKDPDNIPAQPSQLQEERPPITNEMSEPAADSGMPAYLL